MTRRPADLRRRAGFTLVEVLAALVLIGVVLPVAMRGVSIALMAASKAKHTGEATELARNKLEEMAMAADPTTVAPAGDFGVDWPGYRYESTTITRDYGVNELTVEVFWKSRGEDESLKLSTLAYPNAYLVGSTTTTTDTGQPAAQPGGTQ